jgi:hypothetical protein
MLCKPFVRMTSAQGGAEKQGFWYQGERGEALMHSLEAGTSQAKKHK